ncbi:MAG: hypothetical protein U0556_09895 [Dehalococcoidia bacterium]
MIEIERAVEWAVDTLKADDGAGGVNTLAGGRIYSGRSAPPEATRPYVLVHGEPGEDLLGNGGRIWHAGTLVARGVAEGWSDLPALALADRIDGQLEGKRHQPAGSDATLVTCQRERSWRNEYIVAGIRFVELGGRYRVAIQ